MLPLTPLDAFLIVAALVALAFWLGTLAARWQWRRWVRGQRKA